MLTIVTHKWHTPGYRSVFTGEHVNILRNMVARNYRHPHEFICLTDDPTGIDTQGGIRVLPLPELFAGLQNPSSPLGPSCYRRLHLFSEEARTVIGERIVSLDLDCVVVGDLTPLWHRPEQFVIWGDTNPTTPYNGGMFLLTAGTRTRVFEEFDPVTSPILGKKMRYYGSDQAWIVACLGSREAKWTRRDGVLSYRNEIAPVPTMGKLPKDARIVFFHGRLDPWSPEVQHRHEWVRENWR